jgi:hypothetical protein
MTPSIFLGSSQRPRAALGFGALSALDVMPPGITSICDSPPRVIP